MDYKRLNSPLSTITRDMNSLGDKVGNTYETVAVIGKRANQIEQELKVELDKKLQEFASYSDSIEEVFENREQIEISRFYEKMPKPTLLATQEFIEDKIYYRNPLKEKLKK
ncbi:MAG: DNA-directed RNA polymerase subunit omega [Paludibacteraceae bacterium]